MEPKFDLNNLPDLKMWVNDVDDSSIVQELFFKLGYSWIKKENNFFEDNDEMKPIFGAIFANAKDKTLFMENCDYTGFAHHGFTRITLSELSGLASTPSYPEIYSIRGEFPSEDISGVDALCFLFNGYKFHLEPHNGGIRIKKFLTISSEPEQLSITPETQNTIVIR